MHFFLVFAIFSFQNYIKGQKLIIIDDFYLIQDFYDNTNTGVESMANKRNLNPRIDNKDLNAYLRAIGQPEYDVLTKEQEAELMRKYRNEGDLEAKNQLIMHNARLIPFIMAQNHIYTPDPMDMIQAGNMGLIEAVENFNPDEGTRLGTYASFIIKKYMMNAIATDLNKVYIPFGMTHKIEKYKQLKARVERENRELTDELIMEELKIGATTLKTLKNALGIEYTSMSAVIRANSDGEIHIADLIEDDNIAQFERELVAEDNHKLLLSALGKLNPREYDIVTSTYGFGCEKMSSRQLAEKYAISMERVCQIRKQACNKMKGIFNRQGVYGSGT